MSVGRREAALEPVLVAVELVEPRHRLDQPGVVGEHGEVRCARPLPAREQPSIGVAESLVEQRPRSPRPLGPSEPAPSAPAASASAGGGHGVPLHEDLVVDGRAAAGAGVPRAGRAAWPPRLGPRASGWPELAGEHAGTLLEAALLGHPVAAAGLLAR